MNKTFYTLIIAVMLLLTPFSYAQVNSVSVVKDPVFGTNEYVLLLSIGTLYAEKVKYQRIYEAPHYLSEKLPQNFKVENPFILEWKTLEEYTKYNLYRIKPIYQVDIKHYDCGFFGCSDDDVRTWVANNCYDFDKDGVKSYVQETNILGRATDVWCAGLGAKIGDAYTISSPQPYWKTQFKLSNGKETETFYLGTDYGYSVRIDNKALIRFSGLTLFDYPKNPNNVIAFISTSGEKTIIDYSYINIVNNIYNDDAYQYVYQVATGQATEISQESNINGKLAQAKYTWTNNADFPKNKVTFTSSGLTLHTDQPIAIQNFNVYLNGNWIGIIIPQGQPEIVDIDYPKQLTATQTGTVKVKVKNTGDGEGNFEVRLVCTQPLTVYQPALYLTIEPGQTKTATFTIGTIQQKSEAVSSCDVYAKDTTSGKQDKKSFTLSIKPMAECEEGQKQVVLIQGTYRVLECENGQFSKIVLACGVNEYPQADLFGNYKCVSIQQSENIDQTQSENPLTSLTGMLLKGTGIGINIVSSLIAGLIVFFLTRKAQGDIKITKTKAILLLLVSIIAGIITYLYWWVVLIVIGLALIVKLVI